MKYLCLKKIKPKKCVLFMIGILLINSCTKTLDNFDVDKEDPKIVLNAILDPDSTFKINITRSIGILEEEKLNIINDANVYIYEEDVLTEVLDEYSNGFYYKTDFKPLPGAQYKIIVEANGYETVESDITIPNRPEIINIDTTTIISKSEDFIYYHNNLQVVVTLKNQVDKTSYYMIQAKIEGWDYYYTYDDNYDSTYYNSEIDLESNDPKMEIAIGYSVYPVSENSGYGNWGTKFIFSNKLMNGSKGDVVFGIADYMNLYPDHPKDSFESLTIMLSQISEDYYQYLKSLSLYTDDPFESFFVEKVTSYTNVSNGMGIVAAQATDKVIIQKPLGEEYYPPEYKY